MTTRCTSKGILRRSYVWLDRRIRGDSDPNKAEKQYELNKYMHAWVSRRLINGSRGGAVGIRDVQNKLVGCMTVAPSYCAKIGLI